MLGISLLNFVNRRAGDLLIGLALGPVALGLYAVATKVLNLGLDLLVTNIQKIALPVFSRMSEDKDRLVAGYLRATSVTTLVAFPGFTMLALFGTDLAPLVFGSQWTAAGPLVVTLAFLGPVQSIATFNNSMMLATGHSRLALTWTGINAVTNVAVLLVTVHISLHAVAIGFVARGWVLLPVGLFLVRRVSSVPLWGQFRVLAFPALGCVAMALLVLLARRELTVAPVAELLILGPIAGACYLVFMGLIRRDLARQVLGRLRRRPARLGGQSR